MVWLLPVASVLLARLQTGDVSVQIRAGSWMLDAGELMRRDIFTYTVGGRPWLNQQWGAEIVLGPLYGAVGWRGLIIMRALFVAVASGLTYRRTRAAGADPLVAGTLVIVILEVAFLLPGTVALRSQLLAVPLFLCSLWLLSDRHRHLHRLLWLVPIGVAWANIHGSFLLLTAMLTVAFLADVVARRKRDATWTGILAAVSLVTPLVTPWGAGTYGYVADLLSSPVVRRVIEEWKPLWQRTPAGPVFLAIVVSMIGLVLWKGTRRPTLEETLQLFLFTALAVWSGRNLLWWALAAPPIMGGLLSRWRPDRGAAGRSGLLVGCALAVLIVIGIVHVFTVLPTEALLGEAAPQGITDAVDAASSGGVRVFDGWWGSWFELQLPDIPMFIDVRAEVFPDAVWADFFRAMTGAPGWEEVFDRWRIGVVVAEKEHQGALVDVLRGDPGWTLVHEDDEGVVFVRTPVRTSMIPSPSP